MIRRELPNPVLAAQWILISQIDHAHLAARLADYWGADGFAPLAPREALLWAIEHHDDGWQGWEQAPDVDAVRGQPRSFIEMQPAESVAIWSASIDAAQRAGPLQAYVVAGHFCALARRAGWHKDETSRECVERFLARYEALASDCQRAWQAENPSVNTPEVARLALQQLQFFDSLSLWFCCAEATEPDQVESPAGPTLTLSPLDRKRIRLSPWPLTVASLNLEVPARAVPIARYASRAELAAAPSQPVLLGWHLEPSQQNR